MFLRISALFVLLQCGQPDMEPDQLIDVEAGYMKYVPGAGGGRGIMFTVRAEDSIPNLSIKRFVINEVDIPAHVTYEKGRTVIEASVFYADPERTENNPNPDPVNPVLYNQKEYTGFIYFAAAEGESDTLYLSEFEELESPLFQ